MKIRLNKKLYFVKFIKISKGTKFRIDGNIHFAGTVHTSEGDFFSVTENAVLTIGDNVYFNRNIHIATHDSINIGDNCIFGPGVLIFDHDHRIVNGLVQMDEFTCSSITIGKRCWIGAGVIILRGSQIGEGSIIGAGTIVKGVIPPHAIVLSENKLIIQSIQPK